MQKAAQEAAGHSLKDVWRETKRESKRQGLAFTRDTCPHSTHTHRGSCRDRRHEQHEERARGRTKIKTKQAREREKDRLRRGGTDRTTGKNSLNYQGTRKVFKEVKKQSSSEEGREE